VDSDHDCIQYITTHKPLIQALKVNICNPTPAIGWNNTERKSFWDRCNPDTIMCLALLHHLCISNNTPLDYVAKLFSEHCEHLIIEWCHRMIQRPPQSLSTGYSSVQSRCIQERFQRLLHHREGKAAGRFKTYRLFNGEEVMAEKEFNGNPIKSGRRPGKSPKHSRPCSSRGLNRFTASS